MRRVKVRDRRDLLMQVLKRPSAGRSLLIFPIRMSVRTNTSHSRATDVNSERAFDLKRIN